MNKKGFTLIELLAVISLLAIVALVAFPAVDRALREGRGNLSKTQEKQIIKGAQGFFANNTYCLPGGNRTRCQLYNNSNCSSYSQNDTLTKVPVSCLQNLGYLPANIVDYNKNDDASDRNYSSTTVVSVTKNGSNYSYKVESS